MALLADRVRESWTGTGQGNVVLPNSAPDGYVAFADAFTTADEVFYFIVGGAQWEAGSCPVAITGGAATLERTEATVFSGSNGTTRVDFSAGVKEVYCSPPAAMLLDLMDAMVTAGAGITVTEGVVAVDGTVVRTTRTLSTSGLASGGGDLSANRTVTVSAASQAQAEAGTATTVAMTPQRAQQHYASRVIVSTADPSGSPADKTLWLKV